MWGCPGRARSGSEWGQDTGRAGPVVRAVSRRGPVRAELRMRSCPCGDNPTYVELRIACLHAWRAAHAVYLTCAVTARTSPPPRRTEVTPPSIPASALRRTCGHGRVTAPGARSAGGAAMWHAGAASHGVRMSLRGDAWRRGSPRGYRWPVRTARWPQSGARTNGPGARVCGSALCGGSAWPAGFATRRVANPQGHQRFMACSCAATAGHETPLLCAEHTAGRAAS